MGALLDTFHGGEAGILEVTDAIANGERVGMKYRTPSGALPSCTCGVLRMHALQHPPSGPLLQEHSEEGSNARSAKSRTV